MHLDKAMSCSNAEWEVPAELEGAASIWSAPVETLMETPLPENNTDDSDRTGARAFCDVVAATDVVGQGKLLGGSPKSSFVLMTYICAGLTAWTSLSRSLRLLASLCGGVTAILSYCWCALLRLWPSSFCTLQPLRFAADGAQAPPPTTTARLAWTRWGATRLTACTVH